MSVLLRQLFDAQSSTYTYLIADPASGQAALVDPVLEQLERDITLLQELGLSLSLCLETHLHADHITAAGQLRQRTGCRLVVPAAAGLRGADQLLRGQERLPLGAITIEAIATPKATVATPASSDITRGETWRRGGRERAATITATKITMISTAITCARYPSGGAHACTARRTAAYP